MKTLKSYFDKIVVCNLLERPDRMEFFKGQYEKLFGTFDVEVHTSVLHPLVDQIAGAFTKLYGRVPGEFRKGPEMSYLFEHYTILKKAYVEGVEHLLLLEDDICFHRDPQFIFGFLDSLPADYDIAHGDYSSTLSESAELVSAFYNSWVKHPRIGLWNNSFLALSRKGIEYALSIFAKYAVPADYPYWCSVLYPELNVWSSTKPLAVQMSAEDSNISKKSAKVANVMYTYVNRANYFAPKDFMSEESKKKVTDIYNKFEEIKQMYPLKQLLKDSH